jgi:hypothetical protein
MVVTIQAIVMVFGALTAAVGVLLLFLRQESGRTTIRIVGQEFEISTPALVVFLCGCVIFVLPLLRPMEGLNRPAFVFGSPAARPDGSFLPAAANVRVGGEEQEPNTQITEANVVQFATRVQGTLDENDRDYFRFRTPETLKSNVRVILRKTRPGGFFGGFSVFDVTERRMGGDVGAGNDSATFAFEAKAATDYYVMVTGDRGPYELEIRQE